MTKTIQEDFLYKKVYEFSYATFSIASSAKNKQIAELLESKAVSLLDSILIADYEKTKNLVYSIITLTGLLVDSGNLHPVNREVLIRESERINLAIEALPKAKRETLSDLNLNKIFSKTVLPINPVRSSPPLGPFGARSRAGATSNGIKRQIADKPIEYAIQSEVADKGFADEIADKSETRQSAIIEKLGQTENLSAQAGLPADKVGCRLNELQAIFPDVSERTLRYDLESLISRGLVERLGSRRNSFYKIKNGTNAVIELSGHSTINPGLKQ
ncbi:MAG: hypothetical protein Q7K44_00665 [Candidatus Liptonbacteria bacterium]|nr:hypothetical protein [Candidatus Liptonbacteria bacterium]